MTLIERIRNWPRSVRLALARRKASRPGLPPTSKPAITDAILGLDFGTSCTKVVIRTPFLGGGRAMPVRFDTRAGSAYLLPTILHVESNGVVSLAARATESGAEWVSLKARLLDAPDDAVTLTRAAAYLGLVIEYATGWYRRSEKANLRGRELRWQLNLGIPSPGYGDEVIRGAFERVATAAWALSELGADISLERARAAVEGARIVGVPVEVVPEVVAEVVGYARSPLRRQDLHLLVDVGASTLDVCGFILFAPQKEEDQYALLTAKVERLGAHELHFERVAAVGADSCRPEIHAMNLADPLLTVPDSIQDYPKDERGRAEPLEVVDERFQKRCVDALMSCLHHLKTKRYPGSSTWDRGLPVFLCGGGAEMAFYQSVVAQANERSLTAWQVSPFSVATLPVPECMGGARVSEDLFRRLSVAYGLSFDRFEIGKILPPDAVPDAPLPGPGQRREFVGKEQV